MRTIRIFLAASLALAVAGAPLRAQAKPDDAFQRAMFDPQFVLRNAQAISLSAAQRKNILDELKAAQIALAPLQVDMTGPAMELQEIVDAVHVDEAKAVATVEQVLRIENEVKKRQVMLIVRIKNLLTAEQQAKLRALRDAAAKPGDASPDGNTDATP